MKLIRSKLLRIICSLVLLFGTVSLAVPVVHAAEGHASSAFASAAARRIRLAKLPHRYHSPLAGEGSAVGFGQALLVEALIGLIGVGATIVFVTHRRRQHSSHHWQV